MMDIRVHISARAARNKDDQYRIQALYYEDFEPVQKIDIATAKTKADSPSYELGSVPSTHVSTIIDHPENMNMSEYFKNSMYNETTDSNVYNFNVQHHSVAPNPGSFLEDESSLVCTSSLKTTPGNNERSKNSLFQLEKIQERWLKNQRLFGHTLNQTQDLLESASQLDIDPSRYFEDTQLAITTIESILVPKQHNKPGIDSPVSSVIRSPQKLEEVRKVGTKQLDFAVLGYDVQSPPPPTSAHAIDDWPSQITPFLASQLMLFKLPWWDKRQQLREITPSERGHWKIRTKIWPKNIQYTFWKNMAKFIELGHGGMATWMCRPDFIEGENCNELGVVEVWCWAELAEHLYLIIFANSYRWVKWSEAQWFDFKNDMVIQMPVFDPDQSVQRTSVEVTT